jgi:diacylglycerol kinase (ATP)
MRVLLLHNPAAGNEDAAAAALVRAFDAAGHSVTYWSTGHKGWKKGLDAAVDVVVVAGGDGTVRKAALALAARPGIRTPLSIIPTGVANNIARMLGIRGTPESIAAGLTRGRMTRLALGAARASWGVTRFVESAGVGFFARMLVEPPAPDVKAGAKRVLRRLAQATTRHMRITADGRDLTGDYLLALAMNGASIGPRMELAPEADVGDHQLCLLLIGESQRAAVTRYLERLIAGETATIDLETHKVRHVWMDWKKRWGHVDDSPWPPPGAKAQRGSGWVTLEVDTLLAVLTPEASPARAPARRAARRRATARA